MISSILVASFVAAVTLVPQSLAKLYLTSPVASTTCQAGQPCTVSWNDDGNAPTLSQIGACTVGLYVGSQTTQFELQPLGNVDVSQQATASFTPNANVGANSNLYFIRFTSVGFMDGQFPYEGFSAKFTLSGMTGTFNDTEASAMTAATTAIGSSTTGTTPASTTSPGSSTVNTGSVSSTTGTGTGSSRLSVTTTSKASSGTTSHTPSTTSSKGAAVPVLGSSSHAVALAAVIVSAFFAAAAF